MIIEGADVPTFFSFRLLLPGVHRQIDIVITWPVMKAITPIAS